MSATMNVKPSLIREAIFNQYNLILLGGDALFSLAVGSVGPLLLGLAGEMLWLALGAPSPRFRRWVATQVHLRHREKWTAEVNRSVLGLDGGTSARVLALGAAVAEVAELIAERPGYRGSGLDDDRLGALLTSFSRLAGVHQRLAHMLGDAPLVSIQDEIAELGRSLADEKNATTRMSLRQSLALTQRRLRQAEQVEAARRGLDLKMGVVEKSLDYLRTQLLADRPAADVLGICDEMMAATRFNPDVEAEAAALVRGRITSITRQINLAALQGSESR
jgi:hypothetical protein